MISFLFHNCIGLLPCHKIPVGELRVKIKTKALKIMKKILTVLALSAFIVTIISCDRNGNTDKVEITNETEAALYEMYPDATDVSWQFKSGYSVASFSSSFTKSDNSVRRSAWFDDMGGWYMTETDITYDRLPEAVKAAFESSEYASWTIDDIDMLERGGVETIYVIEVEGVMEGRTVEMDLYYSPDGILVKQIADADSDYDYDDYIPTDPGTGIRDFIEENYPGARIVEVDEEGGYVEVEIIDGGVCRELLFEMGRTWIYTKTGLRLAEVPENIMQFFNSSEYSSARIDDVDHYLMPGKEFYRFELEGRGDDVEIDIYPDGTIEVVDRGGNGGNGNGQMVGEEVAAFIEDRYPGAVILEYDYDDGMLEVEIFHDSREKDVYFNGADEWVWSKWEVRVSELPAAVIAALDAEYGRYEIDDAEFVETPSSQYYVIEIEFGDDNEIELRMDADGNIL